MEKPITFNFLHPTTEYSVLLSFAFTTPSHAADLTKGQGSTIVLGRFSAGTSKNLSPITRVSLHVIPGPCSDGSSFTRTARKRMVLCSSHG